MDPSDLIAWAWDLPANPKLHLVIILAGYAWLSRKIDHVKRHQKAFDRDLRDVRFTLEHLKKIIGWRRTDRALPLPSPIGATLDPEQEAAIRGVERRRK